MRRSFNLGNLLVLAGLLGLLASFFAPSWSAERVARVEERAEQCCRLLLEVTLELGAGAADDELLAAFRSRCLAAGQPESDLPEIEGHHGTVPVFGNRHYLFRAAPRPPEPGEAEVAGGPVDAYAWPRTILPPGRTVFFFPSDGMPAFTRNLAAGFHGMRRAPHATAGLPNGAATAAQEEGTYRSSDEERWIVLPRAQQ